MKTRKQHTQVSNHLSMMRLSIAVAVVLILSLITVSGVGECPDESKDSDAKRSGAVKVSKKAKDSIDDCKDKTDWKVIDERGEVTITLTFKKDIIGVVDIYDSNGNPMGSKVIAKTIEFTVYKKVFIRISASSGATDYSIKVKAITVKLSEDEGERMMDEVMSAPVQSAPVVVAKKNSRTGKKGKRKKSKPKSPPMRIAQPAPVEQSNSESYQDYGVNKFVKTSEDALSTFSIDVDTASYTIARRKLNEGTLPPKDAVRVEEFINFFRYDYPNPESSHPFGVSFEAAPSPTGQDHYFMRVGIQGRFVPDDERPPFHLVYLVDTSGSMHSPDKLGLAKTALKLLVNNLKEGDTVALCTYAGSTRIVLEPTGMDERDKIIQALENLRSGGSTAMSSGLENAYGLAYKTFKKGHVNRVIVLSDGDANVGATSHDEILKRIEHFTKEGVTLSVIGLGMGNYKDTTMEQLANKGNGNYYYIDSEKEAKRIFVDRLTSTLQVIAKDVKIQVEFDPKAVTEYRLIGYENRDIADKDFRNDAVDAGEIGAGHQVTAIYELKMVANTTDKPATVRIRYKEPDRGSANELEFGFEREFVRNKVQDASRDFQFVVAVAMFGEKLRKSPYAENWGWPLVVELAEAAARDQDDDKEFAALVRKASEMQK